jgi:Flp pilus assembly protein TadG
MRSLKYKLGNQRGVAFILVIIAIGALLAFAALALDVGTVMVVKNELHNVSDAAALAATRQLGRIYEEMSYEERENYNASADAATIISVAQQVGGSNKVAGSTGVTIHASDVEIGRWDEPANPLGFRATLSQPDAVRVMVRKDGSANGPVATFFAGIFGRDTIDVSAKATAALTGQSTAEAGGLPIPVAISRAWVEGGTAFHFCNQPVRFYPTNDPSSCAGWNVYNRYSNANDNNLRATIADLQSGAYQSPATTAHVTEYEFTGGTMSTQTFNNMLSLFQARRNRDLNHDGVNDAWEAGVPVYDSADCGNPNGRIMIVGFATIVITGVQSSPAHQIDGYVVCNNIESGRGSGRNYGTMGSIPGLVQ